MKIAFNVFDIYSSSFHVNDSFNAYFIVFHVKHKSLSIIPKFNNSQKINYIQSFN